jgi:hypothetical protein
MPITAASNQHGGWWWEEPSEESGGDNAIKVVVITTPHDSSVRARFAAQQPYWVPSSYPFSSLALYFSCLILGPLYGRVLRPSWELILQFKFGSHGKFWHPTPLHRPLIWESPHLQTLTYTKISIPNWKFLIMVSVLTSWLVPKRSERAVWLGCIIAPSRSVGQPVKATLFGFGNRNLMQPMRRLSMHS